jgi:hypothetical protein
VPIFNERTYAEISNDRLLKMKTSTARYTFTVRWQPGKRQMASDALSRRPRQEPTGEDLLISVEEDEDREFVVASLITALEADDGALLEIQQSGRSDGEYQALERAIHEG